MTVTCGQPMTVLYLEATTKNIIGGWGPTMTFTTKCEFSIKSAGNLENAKKKFQ